MTMVNPQPQPQGPDAILAELQPPSHPIGDRTLSLLSAHYQILRFLDSNPFDTTFEIVRGDTPKLLKILNPKPSRQPKAVRLFQEEAELLKDIDCPGIPKIDDTRTLQERLQESDPFLYYLVVEKIDGIPLNEWMESRQMEPISQKLALNWLKQATTILAVVHQNNFIHQNIKPKNLVLKPDGQLALVNF